MAVSKPATVALNSKVLPRVLAEVKRVAHRMGLGYCTLAAQILSAWARGNVFCRSCGYEHPVHHPEHIGGQR